MKGQSAMEYLITYGWMVLIAAVFIGALFALGVFNTGGLTAPECVFQAGFACVNFAMNSNGILQLTVIQSTTTPINITSIGCSSNASNVLMQPIVPKQIYVPVGSTFKVAVQCYNVTGIYKGSLGSVYQGTLELSYKDAVFGASSVAKGVIIAKVATGSNLSASYQSQIPHYIPITITNSQSSVVTAGTPIMVPFAAASYTSYEANGLQNVLFFYPNGTRVPSWMEGDASNELNTNNLYTASNVIFWIKPLAPITASGGTAKLYLGFAVNTINVLDGKSTGEAPQLSSTYGQYDNGASVFSFYDGFQGTSLSSSWTALGSGMTVNNGLFSALASGTANGINTVQQFQAPLALDSYMTANNAGCNAGILNIRSASNSLNYQAPAVGYRNPGYFFLFYYTTSWAQLGSSTTSYTIGVPHVFGQYFANGNLKTFLDYGTVISYSGSLGFTSNIIIGPTWVSDNTGCSASGYTSYNRMYWIRVRTYPPNGANPGVSFGTFT